MKSLARSYVWWPNMDSTLENKVRTCNRCQIHRKNPPEVPLHPWEWRSRPCERVHIDYAGPFLRTMFLILVDAYSKWLEVHPTRVTTSRRQSRNFGQPLQIMAFPQLWLVTTVVIFVSEEFEDFLTKRMVFTTGKLLRTTLRQMDWQRGLSRLLKMA